MRLDLPAIADWNRANERARREHAAHPITACMGVRLADSDDEYACPNVRKTRDTYCGRCRAELARAAKETP